MENLKKYKKWIALALVLIIVAILNPNQSQHQQKIMENLGSQLSKEKDDEEDNAFAALGEAFAGAIVANNLSVSNYIFFSTGTLTMLGKSRTVTFGALGCVYYIPSNDEVK